MRSASSSPPPDEVAPGDELGAMAEHPSPRRRRRGRGILRGRLIGAVGLRRRILLTFTLGSMALSAFLAITTYGLVRSNLLDQRDSASVETAARNAQEVLNALRTEPDTSGQAIERLQNLGVEGPVIRYNDQWSAGGGRYSQLDIPGDLQTRVLEEGQWARMITDVRDDTTALVVGIPIPRLGAYFEFFSLDEDQQTLNNVGLSLFLASVITTALGVLLGVLAARRAVRPVADAAQAAKALAGGHLETRLPPSDDPDLGVLASSFNDMASALQQRIERDARFASDVSHELRSPLMTLSASVEVMEARRHELPERAQSALDLLTSDVSRFQGLVEDLLEISRFDAGAIRLHLEDLRVTDVRAQRRRRQRRTQRAGDDDAAGRPGRHPRRPPAPRPRRRQPHRQRPRLRRRRPRDHDHRRQPARRAAHPRADRHRGPRPRRARSRSGR